MSALTSPHRPEGRVPRLAVCIPTYRRPHLLRLLVGDLGRQTRTVSRLVVVDGDPASGEVARVLREAAPPHGAEVVYVPSNHGNLSYQRYLGWRAAAGCEVVLYLDDDIRVAQADAVERVVAPLARPGTGVVGVTAHLRFGDVSGLGGEGALLDQHRLARAGKPRLVRWLGSARRIEPGGLSPSGHRRMPVDRGEAYAPVAWLHGGVMAYRMDALTRDCFSDDLFALDHVRCGKGEDTFLSRRVGTRGKLLSAFCATFDHPEADLPKAYPTAAYRLGYATAYSRRLLNDNFRGFEPPKLVDRWALVRSYAGTGLLAWSRAARSLRRHRYAYALGYTVGAARGLLAPPSARRLTPGIDWWKDAEVALCSLSRVPGAARSAS